jgi:error-prone DNA polymerase
MAHALPDYAELHCLSNFTFLRGASHAEELAARAAKLGYTALAITDECSLAGVVRAHVAAKAAGLPLIIGSEIRFTGPDARSAAEPSTDPVTELRLVLLATSRAGYGRLSALITLGRRRSAKGHYSLSRADLAQGVPGCLALLIPADGDAAQIASPAAVADARWLAERFPGSAWIAAELHCGPDDRARLAALEALSRASGLPLVAAGDVHMHVRSRRRLQDVLTAIRLRTPVAECGRRLLANGERHLRARLRLAQLYPPALLAETVRIAGRCRFSLDELRYEYPAELVPPGETPASHLRHLTEEGLLRRFPAGVPADVRMLIERELALIVELRYEPFFLTVHDIVWFAKGRNILCQGRGSAANSAVCYALGITEVNPVKQSLLFERFISRERDEPPDIDVDFEHQRREEVIQYVYGKYGRERAALAATVISYRPKSALRDAGRALGLDEHQLDRLSRAIAWWDDRHQLPQRLAEAGFDPESPVIRDLIHIAQVLHGFPRHLSQHVGGFVISRGPLSELVPVENAAMPERCIIQWDKDDLESLGLLKVDILALGMLSVIRRTFDLVNALPPRPGREDYPLSMDSLLQDDDPDTYAMIRKADTVGVFQIESRAQMSMLPRLKPAAFYDLVIEVAIVRPGPIQGGMVHPYLKRRNGTEPVTYPNEEVKAVLKRTLGIPIFQEQVMKLAEVAAGFSPGEADQLRRSMAAWRRKGGLEHLREKLVGGMLKRGYPPEFAEGIYRQILGFGEYGFPESHSVSFALLAYVSAWLKCHEPAAFLVALLNSQPMGFYAPAQLVQDARRHGVEVRAVDVLASAWDCTLEDRRPPEHPRITPSPDQTPEGTGQAPPPDRLRPPAPQPAVRLGLRMVKGLSEDAAARIVSTRRVRRPGTVDDLAHRASLNRHDLQCLAEAGALEPLAGHRRQAHWAVAGVETLPSMLRDAPVAEPAIALPAAGEGAEVLADYASLGLTLGRHPVALLRHRLARMGFASAEASRATTGGRRFRAAGIVTGRQRPGTASGVVFVTLEDETGSVNVIVWRDLADRQRRELLKSRLMGVDGVLEREGDVIHLVATRLHDHSALLGRLQTRSRDFH